MTAITDDLVLPPRRFSLATAIRRNPTIAFGAVLLAALIIVGIFAPYIAPADPFKGSMLRRLKPIGFPGYPLGGDELGIDHRKAMGLNPQVDGRRILTARVDRKAMFVVLA